jgi:hypothetical protein
MGELYPGEPAAMLRIEFNLSKPVRDVLTGFTEASNTESLRIYSGAARIVDGRAMYGRPIRRDGKVTKEDKLPGKISALRNGLTNSAVKLLHLSDHIELRDDDSGSRLFIEPARSDDLRELVDLFENSLPNEIASKGDLDKYVYVDFGNGILAKNALKRANALGEFKRMARDPSIRNAFYVNNPSLQTTSFLMPPPKATEESALSHPDIIEEGAV